VEPRGLLAGGFPQLSLPPAPLTRYIALELGNVFRQLRGERAFPRGGGISGGRDEFGRFLLRTAQQLFQASFRAQQASQISRGLS